MRLFIIRDQAKGLLGGVKFELRARVELTNEEAELVSKYKAGKEILLKKELKIPFTSKSLFFDIKIDSLRAGQTFKCNNIAEILEYEKNVKESCESFKNYIEIMRSFGGEEEIEFE